MKETVQGNRPWSGQDDSVFFHISESVVKCVSCTKSNHRNQFEALNVASIKCVLQAVKCVGS